MAHYVIGDIQGCFDQLLQLLDKINFSPNSDTLWFTGDLVNRGPKSLETLRFISKLPHIVVTLGNHDLRLLTYAFGEKPKTTPPSLEETLHAPDLKALCHWLRTQPLLHHDAKLGYTLVHAGLSPQWDLSTALNLAAEVESVLKSDHYAQFLSILPHYLDNEDSILWHPELTGNDRLGYLVNYFTRIRFCETNGRLDLKTKGATSVASQYIPWFTARPYKQGDSKVLFGHWAALHGKTNSSHCLCLDTGCDYGHALTAMRLEDGEKSWISCACGSKT